jgi:hypothetical protein
VAKAELVVASPTMAKAAMAAMVAAGAAVSTASQGQTLWASPQPTRP